MTKNRLEAFSDGVIAIVITIMVLELRVPHGIRWDALSPVVPHFFTYLLSFVFLGIYWSNHHHLLHAAEKVNGAILWANLHLLFWLSLTPAVTAWLGESRVAPVPTAIYGGVLLLAAVAYFVLQAAIVAHHGPESRLKRALGSDFKGKFSILCYAAAIPLAFLSPPVSIAIYIGIALLWLIPDRRIERVLE